MVLESIPIADQLADLGRLFGEVRIGLTLLPLQDRSPHSRMLDLSDFSRLQHLRRT
jgi:hypothetical protein